MSLRKTADEVDEELTVFLEDHAVDKTWGVQERVLVALTARALGAKLVRRGYRLAKRMGGRFWAVHVRMPGVAASSKEEQALMALYALTEELGGDVVELVGADSAKELIAFASQHQITFIVMGQSARSRLDEAVRGSIVNRIMRETRNIDIVVVADSETGTREDPTAGDG
jgi:two-component system sensor histidine kinase KdpD